jgi:hypothetical protein
MSSPSPKAAAAMLDRSKRIFATFDDEQLTCEEIGFTLLFTLAFHSVLSRNKSQTLLEHFDGMRNIYERMFKLVQSTGVERDFDSYKAKERT